MDDWDWEAMEASPLKGTATATKRPTALPPPTENHEDEEGNRQDDHSDHEVDNLDREVLENTPRTQTQNPIWTTQADYPQVSHVSRDKNTGSYAKINAGVRTLCRTLTESRTTVSASV